MRLYQNLTIAPILKAQHHLRSRVLVCDHLKIDAGIRLQQLSIVTWMTVRFV